MGTSIGLTSHFGIGNFGAVSEPKEQALSPKLETEKAPLPKIKTPGVQVPIPAWATAIRDKWKKDQSPVETQGNSTAAGAAKEDEASAEREMLTLKPKPLPKWINYICAQLSRPGSAHGTLVRGELKDFPEEVHEQLLDWVAKKAYHNFEQDDDRYTSTQATKDVMKDRAFSESEHDTVFVSAIQYKNWLGQEKMMPISTLSQVEYDNPPMPEFGKNWGADAASKKRFWGRGLATDLFQKSLAPATEAMGGYKLYSEPQNADWYKNGLNLHEIGEKHIDDQTDPDNKILVKIFSDKPKAETPSAE